MSNYVFEMNAIWNPYFIFFVKIYVGFVADIDIKILGVPPSLGPGMPFLDNDTCAEGVRVIYFYQGFLPCTMPSMDG